MEAIITTGRINLVVQTDDVGNFVTVADLTIRDTDEDEKEALAYIAAKVERDSAKTAPAASCYRDPAAKLLGEFLESSKHLLSKSECGSSTSTSAFYNAREGKLPTGETSDVGSHWRRLSNPGTSGVRREDTRPQIEEKPSGITRVEAGVSKPGLGGFQEPGPGGLQKLWSFSGTSKATATSRSQRVQEQSARETGSGGGERRGIAEGHSTVNILGKLVSDRETEFTSCDLLEANMLSLGRKARQEYNPENYSERWDSARRRDTRRIEASSAQHVDISKDEGSSRRQHHRRKSRTEEQPPSSPLEPTKTKHIYTQARQIESGANVSSESSQQEEDCNREASAGDGGNVDTAIASKNRKRKRKKREIRKRFVKQILVRGENVVLVACSDEVLRRKEETQEKDNTREEGSGPSK